MSVRSIAVLALFPLALAFSETYPVVSWSSHPSNTLSALSAKFPHVHSLLDSILSSDDICTHDAVVFVDQPDLHAADLRTLPPTAHIARALSSAPSARQFPYLPTRAAAAEEADVAALLQAAAERCASRMVSLAPGQGGVSLTADKKHVVSLNFPSLAGASAQERKDALLKHDALLAGELASLAATFPNHLIIYAGSSSSSAPLLTKRAAPVFGTNARNGTASTGGILARYQLLTPGLIMTLLIALFVLVPIVFLGVNALASIQIPLQSQLPKAYDATEKKNQ
ncbi:hypothetical protein C8R43DRAFT_1022812 [Mycena crocata]|nr:hypothetical protein C8R43DRAFT_1022812 [Mycena crocata]